MTIREFISAVRQTLNTLSLDNFISGEYIYNVGLSSSRFLTKRDSDARKLFSNTYMFKTIDCIEMVETDAVSCGVKIPGCKKVMKSKEPIPETFTYAFGNIIIVSNITKDKFYSESNPSYYKSISGQKYKSKENGYFWLENKHIIIPDSSVKLITVTALFSNPQELLDKNLTENNCGKILDQQFPVIPYLEDAVLKETLNTILTLRKIPKDEDSNLNSVK
jgi:hypothetical protein